MMIISQEPHPLNFSSRQDSEPLNWLHCGPHKHKNRIHLQLCQICLSKTQSWHHKRLWLKDFFVYKSRQKKKKIVNFLFSLQGYTVVCQTHLSLLYLFPGCVKLRFHYSDPAVQSLLTVLTVLCVCPFYKCVLEDRGPEFSHTFTYSTTTWCTYLFVPIKGVNFGKNSRAVPLLFSLAKLHVWIACNHLKLCILPFSIIVQFQRGHGEKNPYQSEISEITPPPMTLLNETCLWMCSI